MTNAGHVWMRIGDDDRIVFARTHQRNIPVPQPAEIFDREDARPGSIFGIHCRLITHHTRYIQTPAEPLRNGHRNSMRNQRRDAGGDQPIGADEHVFPGPGYA